MEFLTDYEILNPTALSSSLVVKHKSSGQVYTLESIQCSDFRENELKVLMKKIKIRINLTHPNILQFLDHLQHNDVIYLKQEFCGYGSLADFIRTECKEKERQLHENLICRFLYQTALTLKTVECFMGQLNLNTIFLTDEFNIKLYNFYNFDNQKQKEVKMSQLGIIVYELCTLKIFEKSSFENELQQKNYSQAFKGLIISMIKDSSEIKKHINKILCHPTVLLQSSQWTKECSFLENDSLKNVELTSSTENVSEEYSEKLEKLRKKEAGLKIKEQLLKEQERKLANKEKKLMVMERSAKEKLQQAELYLKRCREGGKSISSGSSRSSTQSSNKKMSYEENDDPNYVSCSGDSVTLPTSTRLQVDKIIKPHSFSRTLSEKRIRFKTSPLKEHNFSRKNQNRRSLRHPSRILEEHDIENIKPKSEETQIKDTRRKTLFLSLHNEYENDNILTINNAMPSELNNVGWTEETKRHAFEMLRMMNKNEEEEDGNMKHTYL